MPDGWVRADGGTNTYPELRGKIIDNYGTNLPNMENFPLGGCPTTSTPGAFGTPGGTTASGGGDIITTLGVGNSSPAHTHQFAYYALPFIIKVGDSRTPA